MTIKRIIWILVFLAMFVMALGAIWSAVQMAGPGVEVSNEQRAV